MQHTIGIRDPECGWEPFTTWLDEQGVDPTQAVSITWDDETLDADVDVFSRSNRSRTHTRPIKLKSLPPRRAA